MKDASQIFTTKILQTFTVFFFFFKSYSQILTGISLFVYSFIYLFHKYHFQIYYSKYHLYFYFFFKKNYFY